MVSRTTRVIILPSKPLKSQAIFVDYSKHWNLNLNNVGREKLLDYMISHSK